MRSGRIQLSSGAKLSLRESDSSGTSPQILKPLIAISVHVTTTSPPPLPPTVPRPALLRQPRVHWPTAPTRGQSRSWVVARLLASGPPPEHVRLHPRGKEPRIRDSFLRRSDTIGGVV